MNTISTPLRKEKGVVLVLVALSLVVLMGMAGLAIDLSHAEVNKTRLQNLADSLALSAAISLNKNESSFAAQNYATDNTYLAFRNSAGNQEIKDKLANLTINYSFAVDQPGPYVASSSTDFTRRFARVEVTNMNIGTWFAGVVGFNNMAVSASAVAGSAPEQPCDVTPFAMCAETEVVGGKVQAKDPNCKDNTNSNLDNDCYGYEIDALYCMKEQNSVCISNPTHPSCAYDAACPASGGIGPGNFGFLDFSKLGLPSSIKLEDCIAGNPDCRTSCKFSNGIPTKTGENFGQVRAGFNSRFGIYNPGNLTSTQYPPDLFTGQVDAPAPASGSPDLRFNPPLSQLQTVGSETAVSNAYDNYTNNPANITPVTGGEANRRILAIPFIDCSVDINGKSNTTVVGYGCFYMAREYANDSNPYVFNSISANKKYLYGQFIDDKICQGVGKIVSNVDTGFFKVILYKDPFGGHS
jgi:Flp pilus assembly protein TadG